MKSTAPFVLLAALFVLPSVAEAQDAWGAYTGARNLGFREVDRWVIIPTKPTAQPAPPVQPAAPVELAAPVQLASTPTETAPAEAPPPDSFLAASVSPIPEPTTSALLLAGLGVVSLLYRRRSRK